MPANAGRDIEENLLRIAQDAHAASAALQRLPVFILLAPLGYTRYIKS